jgi:hypothetical protein
MLPRHAAMLRLRLEPERLRLEGARAAGRFGGRLGEALAFLTAFFFGALAIV